MTGEITRNAWKKTGFEYFPVAATSIVAATPAGGGGGNHVSAVEV